MNITKDFRNELLKRREVEAVTDGDSNPGFVNATKIIAEHFKVSEDVIALKAIRSKYGKSDFLLEAFIYDSLEDKQKVEPKKKEVKKKEGQ